MSRFEGEIDPLSSSQKDMLCNSLAESLLATEKRTRELTQIENITYLDILSDECTKQLYAKYFRHETVVDADMFLEVLLQENYALFEEVFGEKNKELALEKIKSKISVDSQTLSLNALELFTRNKGLEAAIKGIANEFAEDIITQEANGGINFAEEVNQLKDMLSKKRKALESKEIYLREKENQLDQEKSRFMQTINEYCKSRTDDSIAKIKSFTREKEKEYLYD